MINLHHNKACDLVAAPATLLLVTIDLRRSGYHVLTRQFSILEHNVGICLTAALLTCDSASQVHVSWSVAFALHV